MASKNVKISVAVWVIQGCNIFDLLLTISTHPATKEIYGIHSYDRKTETIQMIDKRRQTEKTFVLAVTDEHIVVSDAFMGQVCDILDKLHIKHNDLYQEQVVYSAIQPLVF